LLVVATLAGAQPAPAPSAAPDAPAFDASEDVPLPPGFEDSYALDEIRLGGLPLTEQQQVERWQAELNAGRARAGVMLGAYLAYRALTPSDCEAARAALTKADELGSDQAPGLLAQLSANTTCGPVDTVAVSTWLRKAVPLDYPFAAVELIRLHGEGTTAEDKMQQYLYARVASGYWEAKLPNDPRPGFDAAALAEMEKNVPATDRGRAEAEAARLLTAMLKRHERFTPAVPVEFARADAGAKGSIVGWHADYRHECQWNLKENCRGAQRLTFVDVANRNADFLSCRIELQARDFVTGKPVAEPLTREVLVGPSATRRLLLGDVNEVPDRKALQAKCSPVPRLVADVAAGKCRAKLQGGVDVERFYPPAARARGIEGSAVVRYWVPHGKDQATDAEIASSSGDASLDNAAMATVRSARFTRDCEYGLGSIRIAFKLQ